MFKNFPIIYKTARPAGRTEARSYKHHIINTLTAPQTPNNRISSPHTSYLLPLTSYLLSLTSYLYSNTPSTDSTDSADMESTSYDSLKHGVKPAGGLGNCSFCL